MPKELIRCYQVFDRGQKLDHVSKIKFIACFNAILNLLDNSLYSPILEVDFYSGIVEYYLNECPSSYYSVDEKLLKDLISRVHFIIVEIFNKIVLHHEQILLMENAGNLRRFINIPNVFSLIRLFGQYTNFETSMVPLIFKLISILRKDNDFQVEQASRYLTTKLLNWDTQMATKIQHDTVMRIAETLFVCHTLFMDLSLTEFGDGELIQRLAQLTRTILNHPNDQDTGTQKYLTHIKISAVKIIEKLLTTVPITQDILQALLNICKFDNFVVFMKEIIQVDDIFKRFASTLNDHQRHELFSHIYAKKYNRNVESICQIFPNIDPDAVESLLAVYHTPEAVISNLITNPELQNSAKSKTSTKKPEIVYEAEQTQDYELFADPEINKVNIRLVENQDIEESKQNAKYPDDEDDQDLENDDDFDESDEECGFLLPVPGTESDPEEFCQPSSTSHERRVHFQDPPHEIQTIPSAKNSFPSGRRRPFGRGFRGYRGTRGRF
ncbi:hypothetical protein RF11_01444 [Thelohanellus kitauei]|uniref:Uncharacterized protein n=1 Tax=Thelohanellus kitauei TaxID=669202 RepID=A0A0C2MP94_THEKT|nr:hypothetical protein RF11_01444 [Thelohanellus kitauei]